MGGKLQTKLNNPVFSGIILLMDFIKVVEPEEGMLAYNFTAHIPLYYHGVEWLAFGGPLKAGQPKEEKGN